VCTTAAQAMGRALADSTDALFDVDTAAVVAILAWRGGEMDLCARTLSTITDARTRGVWRLMDIPAQTWDGLADMFTSGDADISDPRAAFSEFLREELARLASAKARFLVVEVRSSAPLAEVLVHALRISVADQPAAMEFALSRILGGDGDDISRRGLLLLMRWAREKNRKDFIIRLLMSTRRGWAIGRRAKGWREILGISAKQTLETLDVEKISMDQNFSYREFTDFRWAVGVFREAERAGKLPAGPKRLTHSILSSLASWPPEES
jgi:hypothetical protein